MLACFLMWFIEKMANGGMFNLVGRQRVNQMRKLSDEFVCELKIGCLQPILKRVKQDHTLMLAIRDGYINIYYRGGNILKVEEIIEQQGKRYFRTSFNDQYKHESGMAVPTLPGTIKSQGDAITWVDAFPHLKLIMDIYFSKHSKPEREYQQLVARENNYSTISNESEYFISDIEFADSELKARFDILAIRWLASDKNDGSNCRPVLIEMKYGDGALGGDSGLTNHLEDIEKLITYDVNRYHLLLEMMESQFKQLLDLGLVRLNASRNGTKVKLDVSEKPEVIFLLANHNPRSTKLSTILKNLSSTLENKRKNSNEQKEIVDLKFFVSSFAGYGLHSECMKTLAQFRHLIEQHQ